MSASQSVKGAFKLTKKERINLPKDFRKVMKFGRKANTKNFIIFVHETKSNFHRLGIVVKREVGPAAFRNRIKRYIREFFRLYKHWINGSLDIVLLVKKGCLINRYKEVEEELRGFFIQ
jgi:ribonuclease P protein component